MPSQITPNFNFFSILSSFADSKQFNNYSVIVHSFNVTISLLSKKNFVPVEIVFMPLSRYQQNRHNGSRSL